ncbi:hypothetical protein [Paraburkholderia heleia]|uniref:hypothetical protein n=1 Tax=Paraburkholderia heleia TaxID=634127 RepID=UPI0005A6E753|nr:hypothetical protein [Paraburkholderia heleia]
MKKIVTASLFAMSVSLGFAGQAFSQTKPLTLDTPIEQIAANPEGKKVLEADLKNPKTGRSIFDNPMYEQFKSMSLKQLQPMAPKAVTDERLEKVAEDLAKLQAQ